MSGRQNIVKKIVLEELWGLLSSSSESDSSDDDFDSQHSGTNHEPSTLLAFLLPVKEDRPREKDCLKTVADYSEWDFFRHMRVTKANLCIIKDTFQVDGFWSNITFHGGSLPLEIEESLYITLR